MIQWAGNGIGKLEQITIIHGDITLKSTQSRTISLPSSKASASPTPSTKP
jgi:hypothetical protein